MSGSRNVRKLYGHPQVCDLRWYIHCFFLFFLVCFFWPCLLIIHVRYFALLPTITSAGLPLCVVLFHDQFCNLCKRFFTVVPSSGPPTHDKRLLSSDALLLSFKLLTHFRPTACRHNCGIVSAFPTMAMLFRTHNDTPCHKWKRAIGYFIRHFRLHRQVFLAFP